MTARRLPCSAYVLPLGSLLTDAEAAHLLTREAAGELLPAVPHRTAAGYVLTARAALTLADLGAHARRVAEVRELLAPYRLPALSA
jgi:hypothetical protein